MSSNTTNIGERCSLSTSRQLFYLFVTFPSFLWLRLCLDENITKGTFAFLYQVNQLQLVLYQVEHLQLFSYQVEAVEEKKVLLVKESINVDPNFSDLIWIYLFSSIYFLKRNLIWIGYISSKESLSGYMSWNEISSRQFVTSNCGCNLLLLSFQELHL